MNKWTGTIPTGFKAEDFFKDLAKPFDDVIQSVTNIFKPDTWEAIIKSQSEEILEVLEKDIPEQLKYIGNKTGYLAGNTLITTLKATLTAATAGGTSGLLALKMTKIVEELANKSKTLSKGLNLMKVYTKRGMELYKDTKLTFKLIDDKLKNSRFVTKSKEIKKAIEDIKNAPSDIIKKTRDKFEKLIPDSMGSLKNRILNALTGGSSGGLICDENGNEDKSNGTNNGNNNGNNNNKPIKKTSSITNYNYQDESNQISWARTISSLFTINANAQSNQPNSNKNTNTNFNTNPNPNTNTKSKTLNKVQSCTASTVDNYNKSLLINPVVGAKIQIDNKIGLIEGQLLQIDNQSNYFYINKVGSKFFLERIDEDEESYPNLPKIQKKNLSDFSYQPNPTESRYNTRITKIVNPGTVLESVGLGSPRNAAFANRCIDIVTLRYETSSKNETIEKIVEPLKRVGKNCVPYNEYGFVIFIGYGEAELAIPEFKGDSSGDIEWAKKRFKEDKILIRFPVEYHHHYDCETIIALDVGLHKAFQHTGGDAIARDAISKGETCITYTDKFYPLNLKKEKRDSIKRN